jgi:hypothetical protein
VIEQHYSSLATGAATVAAEPRRREAGLRGDGERIYGFVLGLATAWGEQPSPTHYLLAIAYRYDVVLAQLGSTSAAVVDALRRRGIHVPDGEPPLHRPWRGVHDVEVDEDELQPLIDVLRRRHPPRSELRWGFGFTDGEPRRALVSAEEGVDLEAALRESRGETD